MLLVLRLDLSGGVIRRRRWRLGAEADLSTNALLTSAGASSGGGGDGSGRKQTCPVHCHLDIDSLSWLMATRFAPFSSYV